MNGTYKIDLQKNHVKLSICICTMESRMQSFENLILNLTLQTKKGKYFDELEILFNSRMDITTGEKRNRLLESAMGDFVVFIDDDDDISNDYVKKIMTCINQNSDVDCISIEGVITEDGKNEKPWLISIDCKSWYESEGKYFRTPNHISPVRREHALEAKFPDITYGEDREYSKRIYSLLKKEAKIKGSIYHYKFINKDQPKPQKVDEFFHVINGIITYPSI